MSRKKRAQDLRKAKDARMKKVAIGGGVLLLAVLAYQMSHMLGGSKSAAPAATTTTTTAGTSTPTTGTPAVTPSGTAAAAVLPTSGSTKLPNSDGAPKRSKSEIYAFGDFSGKDPFAQQISTTSGSSGTTGSSTGSSTGTAAASTPGATIDASVKSLPGSSAPSSSRTLARAGAVTISVNGRSESVRMGASFPRANPLFRLVSISNGVVRIGIAGGSYSSGAQTVSLVAGRTLTLVDTSDGIRYKLRLLSAA
jgi:hypothetical protein